MITVKELKAILADMNESDVVVMSTDSEVDSYTPLFQIESNSVYVPSSQTSGNIWVKELTPDLISQGFGKDDCYDESLGDGVSAVVLYPTE